MNQTNLSKIRDSRVLRIVAICNRLNTAPASMVAQVERELIEAIGDFTNPTRKAPTNDLAREEIEEAIVRHQKVLMSVKDPKVISETVGKVRRLRAQLAELEERSGEV